jgi:hypothetical protein
MADAIEFVQPLLSQKMSIPEEDIIKISKAVSVNRINGGHITHQYLILF